MSDKDCIVEITNNTSKDTFDKCVNNEEESSSSISTEVTRTRINVDQ